METNIVGQVFGIILIVAFAAIVALVGAYGCLMTKRSCPHCRTMISKKVTTCPHCKQGVALTAG